MLRKSNKICSNLKIVSRGLLIGIVVVVVAIVATGTIFLIVPMLQPQVIEIELTMVDYGFDKPGFGPTIRIKAGQLVRIVFINKGAHTHEFMVVKDKDTSLMMTKKIVSKIDAMDLTEEEKLEMYELEHHEAMEMMKMKMYEFEAKPEDAIVGNMIMFDVDPDEKRVIEFVIYTPGEYWYVCQRVAGTWPEIHQERGMFGKLIVEEA